MWTLEGLSSWLTPQSQLQRSLLYITCSFTFFTIAHYHTLQSSHGSPKLTSSPFCPSSSHVGKLPYLSVTPTTLFGIALMAFGTYMRLRSYEALGMLFTFDLCIKPEHRLVTSGPYSFVIHLAHLGSLYLMAGLTFVGLTRGSCVRLGGTAAVRCSVHNACGFRGGCTWRELGTRGL